jgi:hypothetical protein
MKLFLLIAIIYVQGAPGGSFSNKVAVYTSEANCKVAAAVIAGVPHKTAVDTLCVPIEQKSDVVGVSTSGE